MPHVAAVVDEPRHVAVLRRVDDGAIVDAEQVAAADAHCLVLLFTAVGHRLADGDTDVLDHHLVSGDRLQGKQAPVVDTTPRETQLLLAVLNRGQGTVKRGGGGQTGPSRGYHSARNAAASCGTEQRAGHGEEGWGRAYALSIEQEHDRRTCLKHSCQSRNTINTDACVILMERT